MRPSGTCRDSFASTSLSSRSPMIACSICVRTNVGWTELQRIFQPLRAQYSATDLVSIQSADFDALYAVMLCEATSPATEDILTIEAGCCSRSSGNVYLHPRKGPSALIAMV